MKEKVTNLLMIGPFPKPITGNSLANKVAFEGLSKKLGIKVTMINTSTSFFDERVGYFSFKKMFNGIRFNIEGYKIFRSEVVYITPGQTFLGILKYGLLIFFSKLLKNKIVLHVHGNYLCQEYQRLNRAKRLIVKRILGMADRGIVLSELLLPNLTPFIIKENISIVHNFVEDYVLKESERIVKNKNLKKVKIIYLSNLMVEKGVLDLLEALKIMERKGINFEARFAGNIDNRSRDKIEKYFSTLNNVTYLGIVDGDDKREMLLWGNIFVFPSYYKMEGQPLAILEAMATGNVILTSNHAGISDIFSIKNGLFINIKNPEDIVLKIQTIIEKKEKYEEILKYNYLYASNNFRSEKFINRIENIIKAV